MKCDWKRYERLTIILQIFDALNPLEKNIVVHVWWKSTQEEMNRVWREWQSGCSVRYVADSKTRDIFDNLFCIMLDKSLKILVI